MEFNQLINQAIIEMGFVTLTEIQNQVIPLLLEGEDVIAHSHTGTGKTAAYLIPLLEKIDFRSNDVEALIVAPTRELALQIALEAKKIGKYLPRMKSVCLYGGDSINNQFKLLKARPQLVIGTPGRLLDHLNRKTLHLKNVKYLIIDEADEMLKMGFIEDIESIILKIPQTRQMGLFSATMPKVIIQLAKTYMKNAKTIKVIGETSTNSDVIQYYYKVKKENKTEALYRLINTYRPRLSLVFCNTKAGVDKLFDELTKLKVNVGKIHGDLSQAMRLAALNAFHKRIIDVLIATDVASRGLDIKMVDAIFNYDVPEKADHYIHRIGRTGRIGNIGYAFTLVSYGELRKVAEIERHIKLKIIKKNVPTYEKVLDTKVKKLIDDISLLIKNEDFEREYQILNQAIQASLSEDQIIVALLKMYEGHEISNQNKADINEDFAYPKHKIDDSDLIRFHLNIGKKDGLKTQDIIDLLLLRIKINKQEIKSIAILTEFAFFSVPKRYEKQILEKFKKTKVRGKKVVLQKARKGKK